MKLRELRLVYSSIPGTDGQHRQRRWTKTPATPSRKELERRIREASQVLPKERLALSTQCGFSTSIVGNRISVADQEAKLRRVVETARSVWG